MRTRTLTTVAACVAFLFAADISAAEPLKIATFRIDVTPPLGTPLCEAMVQATAAVDDPISARGIVLLSDQKPIVLVAVDWLGIGGAGNLEFREAISSAAGTTPDRVAVHTLHQHDAPAYDAGAEAVAAAAGLSNKLYDVAYTRDVIQRLAAAVKESLGATHPVTHVGTGRGRVVDVASNRRVMGPDGKVKAIRWSATADAAVRAEPEGLIDPNVSLLSFWNGDTPLVSMTYYATHPQSHYGKGRVSADFPGLARAAREEAEPKLVHIHFNGAGGNVTAGKYNDGNPANRARLVERLAAGMKLAWDSQTKTAISAADLNWKAAEVALPPSPSLNLEAMKASVADTSAPINQRLRNARNVSWLEHCASGGTVPISCLHLGSVRVLHMPGELFIEYQLAAQKMRPSDFVCVAAYGDYSPWYIGLKESYGQGGYETSGDASHVAPEAEDVLMTTMKSVLD